MSTRYFRVENFSSGHVYTFVPESSIDRFVVQQDDVNLFSVRAVIGSTAHIMNWDYPTADEALAALRDILRGVDSSVDIYNV